MKYAKYIGTSDARVITTEQWKAAGVDQPTLAWNASNGHTVSTDLIGESAREVLSKDPSIVFTDEAPTEDDMRDAKIEAAINRLRARQAGETVLSASDAIPATIDDAAGPGKHAVE